MPVIRRCDRDNVYPLLVQNGTDVSVNLGPASLLFLDLRGSLITYSLVHIADIGDGHTRRFDHLSNVRSSAASTTDDSGTLLRIGR